MDARHKTTVDKILRVVDRDLSNNGQNTNEIQLLIHALIFQYGTSKKVANLVSQDINGVII